MLFKLQEQPWLEVGSDEIMVMKELMDAESNVYTQSVIYPVLLENSLSHV